MTTSLIVQIDILTQERSASRTLTGDFKAPLSDGLRLVFGPQLELVVRDVRVQVATGDVQARAVTKTFRTLADAQAFASSLQTRAQQLGLTVS